LYFSDEMRYGLISNFRRSWSKKGERASLDQQMTYTNSYLFSAVAPLSGKSHHLLGFPDMNGDTVNVFLLDLKKQHPDKQVYVVWDNAPTHRPVIHRKIPGLTLIQLPSYSPELNPAERFFEEIRRATACETFENIQEQEKVIEEVLLSYINDEQKLKQLVGYEWIREQCGRVS
jgi:transposase